jgi:hypothetical protein
VLPTLFFLLLVVIVVMVYLLSVQNPGNLFQKPSLDVVSVEPGVSVTVAAENFPSLQILEARIDRGGAAGENGIVVGLTMPGVSGEVIAVFNIPDEMALESELVVRLENDDGYYAYQQVTNR